MDTPSGRALWPPKDTWKSLDVSKDGWDWASAAISFGIFDPLDLIHFNFLTTNPREVNWYLWKYVGCVNSDDGKNFTFAGADPGVIFLPQHGYTRKTPGITAVEQKAIGALRKVVPYYPDFWHKGVHLRPKDLEILIHKVATNKVDVIWDTSIKHAGVWRFKDSAIYLGGTDFNTDDLTTLVHEATHALVDIVTASHPAVRHYKYIDILRGSVVGRRILRTRGNRMADLRIRRSRYLEFVSLSGIHRENARLSASRYSIP
jgi:hypothetical protein